MWRFLGRTIVSVLGLVSLAFAAPFFVELFQLVLDTPGFDIGPQIEVAANRAGWTAGVWLQKPWVHWGIVGVSILLSLMRSIPQAEVEEAGKQSPRHEWVRVQWRSRLETLRAIEFAFRYAEISYDCPYRARFEILASPVGDRRPEMCGRANPDFVVAPALPVESTAESPQFACELPVVQTATRTCMVGAASISESSTSAGSSSPWSMCDSMKAAATPWRMSIASLGVSPQALHPGSAGTSAMYLPSVSSEGACIV